MSHLLRVILPDRPGILGAVASALGEVGADILGVDVVERGRQSATDDFVVELPPELLADSLVSAATSVLGVKVESIRPYAGQLEPHRELELLDAMAQRPGETYEVLSAGVAPVFRAAWALVLEEPHAGMARVVAAGGAAPELPALRAPWWPPTPTRTLPCDTEWAPADWGRLDIELAVAPLGQNAILVGRTATTWRPAELVRLQHLASIAATVAAAEASTRKNFD